VTLVHAQLHKSKLQTGKRGKKKGEKAKHKRGNENKEWVK
jgi:hypothetical protein